MTDKEILILVGNYGCGCGYYDDGCGYDDDDDGMYMSTYDPSDRTSEASFLYSSGPHYEDMYGNCYDPMSIPDPLWTYVDNTSTMDPFDSTLDPFNNGLL